MPERHPRSPPLGFSCGLAKIVRFKIVVGYVKKAVLKRGGKRSRVSWRYDLPDGR
jgi:hypothetical protein